MASEFTIYWQGQPIPAKAGQTLAAVLMNRSFGVGSEDRRNPSTPTDRRGHGDSEAPSPHEADIHLAPWKKKNSESPDHRASESIAGGTRRSVVGETRAALCGMGICFECRVQLDDGRRVRACMTFCRPDLSAGPCHD